MAWPTKLTVSAPRERLTVDYDDGTRQTMSSELLRVLTPSAERKGHGTRMVIGGKAAVRIERVEPVGRYAVRIVFDDGHDTGLYTFETLAEIGRDPDGHFAQYLVELANADLDRERPGSAPVRNA